MTSTNDTKTLPETGQNPPPKNLAWEYVSSRESTEAVRLKSRYELFIDGQWCAPKQGRYYATSNPATEQPLAEIAYAGEEDIRAATSAARRAFEGDWGALPGLERGKYLFRAARLLQERAREFAIVETLDNGKPIKESRDFDIPQAINHLFYYAGWADKLGYAFHGRRAVPLGVVGQIIPWNFPLLMAIWKIAPALACGNTVVLKPAETTPLTALLLAELFQEAGLPRGVLNVVTGFGDTGAELVNDEQLNKVAFTGSTAVGKEIQRRLAGRDVRLSLELGGKAANIVFNDAALDQAVEGIIQGIFFNQGQVCSAGSRLLVEESVHDLLVEKLKRRLGSLRLGNPLDKNTDLGAINSKKQLTRIQELVRVGELEGAERYSVPCELPSAGFFFPPTIFTGVSSAQRIAQEEIFGPVLSVMTFRTEAEAVEKANNTCYGLSAGVWTNKGARLFNLASRLEAGVVWGNTFNQFDPTSAFGGYKESGFGREGGRYGLAEYLSVE